MTSVCSVGLDMVAIPGDTPAETIAAIIADEMAIGVINGKSTAARLIPVPGKKAGDRVNFGGLLGGATIMPVPGGGGSAGFIALGGRIPAPVHSFKNCWNAPELEEGEAAKGSQIQGARAKRGGWRPPRQTAGSGTPQMAPFQRPSARWI